MNVNRNKEPIQKRMIVIMAGGVGSRFWPSSTEERPKQFLDILGTGESLLQMTYRRCRRIVHATEVLIVTNTRYADLVAEQLPEVPQEHILCEPTRNNTAPCIAYAALRIQSHDEDAVFAVLPSDHVIGKEDAYVANLEAAFEFAGSHEAIVTLGIQPTRPDTGYGYIELAGQPEGSTMYPVKAFTEKPNKQVAESFIQSGNYVWNAGMFVWSTKTLLAAFEQYAPEVLQPLTSDLSAMGTAGEQSYIDKVYPLTPSISIDYAILEKASNVHCLPCDIAWSDLGTWASLHDFKTDAPEENVCYMEKGLTEDVKGSIIIMEDKRTALIRGLENYIIVSTDEALLIYPRESEQELKNSVNALK